MQMRMLLLVPAVVLLVSPAAASPTLQKLNKNLNSIIDSAGKYSESVTKEYFVEDVSHLAEGTRKCDAMFFCKVHEILAKHRHEINKKKEGKMIMKNLEMYLKDINSTCPELLRNVTSTDVKKPIPDLMEYLVHCIKNNNFNS